MPNRESVSAMQTVAGDILRVRLDTLVDDRRHGINVVVEDTLALCDMLHSQGPLAIRGAGQRLLENLTNSLHSVKGKIESLVADQPRIDPAKVKGLRDALDNAVHPAVPLLFLGFRNTVDPEQYTVPLQRAVEDSERACEQATSAAEAAETTAQELAAERAFKDQAKFFENARVEHSNASMVWLCATVGIMLFALFAVVASFWQFLPGLEILAEWLKVAKPDFSLPILVARVVVVSFLTSAAYWANRNYRANRHNAVLNAHRNRALRTFMAVAGSAEDDNAVKHVLLLQAAEAMFSSQPSGYSGASAPPVSVDLRQMTSMLKPQ